ncbi:MAG: ATP phosphoribosyltransferase regulatory subunit [Aquificae bacterium]|nr:ATP phosphoribosyltransferase regulatory subunit [Aquificota bacterium]
MKIDLPAGVRTFNRSESFQINHILNTVNGVFQKWAYEEIKLPYFEYLEVHGRGLDEEIKGRSFKLVDRSSGEILSLRADFTAQICRYFASLKFKNLPKRYYYTGVIFRYAPPKADNLWERLQTGIELIGSSRLEADAEVIAVASQSLEELGIKDYQIDINNTKIFTALKNLLGLDEGEYNRFMGFVKNREIYSLRDFVKEKGIKGKTAQLITQIPKLKGGIGLIEKLKRDYGSMEGLGEAFGELVEIHRILKEYGLADRISFDLGEPKEFSYYTGIMFEIFIKGFPKPLGQGGRYDNLIARYNGDVPATGFAFDVLNLWEGMKSLNILQVKNYKDFFIIDLTQDKKTAYRLAKILREKGYSVGRDIIDRDYQDSIRFAFSNRYRKVIVIGLDRKGEDIYIYSTEKDYEKININEFLEKIIAS